MKMPKDTKQKNVLNAFESFGFKVEKFAEHIKMRNANTGKVISVPNHKTLKGSTLSQICRVGGIDKTAFFKKV